MFDRHRLAGPFASHEWYARALSSAYHYQYRLNDPSLADFKESDAWELMRRDPKIYQAAQQRLISVAGHNWSVEPASDREADVRYARIVEQALGRIRKFRAARRKLAAAVFRGRSYAFISGRRGRAVLEDDGPARDWWIPHELHDVDKRRIQIVPSVEDGKIRARLEMWSVVREQWEVLETEKRSLFVEHVFDDDEERMGYGRGLLDSLYFIWYAKQIIMREGLAGLEAWSQGRVVGKVDTNRAGVNGTDATTQRDAMIDELEKMRSRHVLVVDKDDDVQFATGGGEGNAIVMGFLEYCDRVIISLVSGALLPFGEAAGVGSMARAEVEQDTAESLIQFDRECMDEAIGERIFPLFRRLNHEPLSAAGLLFAGEPKFVTSTEINEDTAANTQSAIALTQAGIPLRREEVYARTGWTMPEDGDDVFDAPPPLDPIPQQGTFPF